MLQQKTGSQDGSQADGGGGLIGGKTVSDYIWYIQAFDNPATYRDYVAGDLRGPDAAVINARFGKLSYRAQTGDRIDPTEFPTDYLFQNSHPNKKLDLPIWRSNFVHVRNDVAAVLRQFDLGNTVLVPIRITLPDDAGVRADFSILSVANIRPTIDKAMSERPPIGHKRRPRLSSDTVVHPTVYALPDILEQIEGGPDIWIDPDVASTVFVRERLANALQGADFGKALQLRRVRVIGMGDADA